MYKLNLFNFIIYMNDNIINQEHLMKVLSFRRRVFTYEEDKLLAKIVASKKYPNWIEISKQLPGRTSRQCRDRWINYLSPENSFKPWTLEEDKIIVDKVNEIGTKWSLISKQIPGRSDNSIKNRWYSNLKHKCMITMNGKYILQMGYSLNLKNGFEINQNKNKFYYCNSMSQDYLYSLKPSNGMINMVHSCESNSNINKFCTQAFSIISLPPQPKQKEEENYSINIEKNSDEKENTEYLDKYLSNNIDDVIQDPFDNQSIFETEWL